MCWSRTALRLLPCSTATKHQRGFASGAEEFYARPRGPERPQKPCKRDALLSSPHRLPCLLDSEGTTPSRTRGAPRAAWVLPSVLILPSAIHNVGAQLLITTSSEAWLVLSLVCHLCSRCLHFTPWARLAWGGSWASRARSFSMLPFLPCPQCCLSQQEDERG